MTPPPPSKRNADGEAQMWRQKDLIICGFVQTFRGAPPERLAHLTKLTLDERTAACTALRLLPSSTLLVALLPTLGCSVALVMSMKEPSSPSRGCMCIRVQKSCSFLDRGGCALFHTIFVCGPRCSMSVRPLLYLPVESVLLRTKRSRGVTIASVVVHRSSRDQFATLACGTSERLVLRAGCFLRVPACSLK